MRYLTPIAPAFVLATGLLVATPNPSQSSPGPCSQADPVCVNREAAIGGSVMIPSPVYIIQTPPQPLFSSLSDWIQYRAIQNFISPHGSTTICQSGPNMTTICH